MVMQGTKLGIASSVRGRRRGEEKTRRRACVCFFFFLSSGERRESRDAQEKFFETADTRTKRSFWFFFLFPPSSFWAFLCVCGEREKWRGELGYLGGPWRQGYILLFFLSPLPITPRLLSLSLPLFVFFLPSRLSLSGTKKKRRKERKEREGERNGTQEK